MEKDFYFIYADKYLTWNDKIHDWNNTDVYFMNYYQAFELAYKKYGKQFTIYKKSEISNGIPVDKKG
jgi:hypothetical protein